MTALVTWATGLLGGQVTRLLVAQRQQPRVLVRPGDSVAALADLDVDMHRGDVIDRSALEAAVTGVDCVFHCAARTGPWGPEAEYQRTNVQGLETVVRAAIAAGVRRVVHVSSITVHGNDVRGEADERTRLVVEPNPYSRSKVAGERLLQRMIRSDGAPVTIVRPGWIYGPRDSASFARLARKIEKHQMIIVGSGQNRLPLIYVRDAAEGVLLAGLAEKAEGRCYVLVNDEPVTQRDFLAAIASELGAAAPNRRVPYELALMMAGLVENLGRLARRREPPPVMRYGIQLLGGQNRFLIGRAKTELGFSPRVNLAEGVTRSVQWYRASSDRAASVLTRA
jgi:nucleoside-diphosphate-sugar epimerase